MLEKKKKIKNEPQSEDALTNSRTTSAFVSIVMMNERKKAVALCSQLVHFTACSSCVMRFGIFFLSLALFQFKFFFYFKFDKRENEFNTKLHRT